MVAFEAYLDDSGTHDDSPVTVVAGALGEVDVWNSLGPQWQIILDKYGVEVFHATDLAHLRGEFSKENGWDEERKKQFTGDLLDVMGSHQIEMVVIGVQNSVYAQAKKDFTGIKLNAFQFCAENMIAEIGMLVFGNTVDNSVNIVFEGGNRPFWTFSMHYVRELLANALQTTSKLGIAITQDGKENCALQSADLIVYEAFKHWTRGDREIRYPLRELIRTIGPGVGFLLDINFAKKYLFRTQNLLRKFEV